MIDRLVGSVHEAVAAIHDGATIMIGGFGKAGSPIELIHALGSLRHDGDDQTIPVIHGDSH